MNILFFVHIIIFEIVLIKYQSLIGTVPITLIPWALQAVVTLHVSSELNLLSYSIKV